MFKFDFKNKDLIIRKKPKAIKTPAAFWALAVAYFEEVETNPAKRSEAVKSGDHCGRVIDVDQARPFTWEGFEAFLFQRGILSDLSNYRSNAGGRYAEFKEVVRGVGNIIYQQKFEGAALGHFKENIICISLGLKAKEDAGDSPENIKNIAPPNIHIYNVGPPLARSEKDVDLDREDV